MYGLCRAPVGMVSRVPFEEGLVVPVAGKTVNRQPSAVNPSGIDLIVKNHLTQGHGPSWVTPYLMTNDCGDVKA